MSAPEASDPFVGRVIDGRYAIEGRLGEGGLGVVYRATQTRLGRLVAVKVLHGEHASTKALRDRFEREARALAQLRHPNIVDVIDYGIDLEAPFLVMELLEGRPLNEAIRDGIEPARALSIGRAIVAALAYAHARRIVHRDLKPANVFLERGPDGVEIPRVLDFGLAKSLDPAAGDGAVLTRAGAILGTPSYMSPEQASGGATDERSDVYSLGIVLYELLTGVRPFRGAVEDLFRMHLFTELPTLESARPGLPHTARFDEVLRRASAKAARDRYPDAGALLAALDALPPLDAAPILLASPPIAGARAVAEAHGAGAAEITAKPAVAPVPDFTLDRTVAATPAAGGKAVERAAPASPRAAPRSASAPEPASPPAPPRVLEPGAVEATIAVASRATPANAPDRGSRPPLAILVGGAALLVLAIGAGVALSGEDEGEPAAGSPLAGLVPAPEGSDPGATATVTPTTTAPADEAALAPAPDDPTAAASVTGPAAAIAAVDDGPDKGAPLPPELEAIRGDLRPGGRLSFMDRRRLNRWSRAHPGDPRAWILMAHADFENGARTDALTWYENAVATNAYAVDDPLLRRDLVIMSGHGTVGGRARALVLRYFPDDAAAEIDAALREATLDVNERRRLEELRATLR